MYAREELSLLKLNWSNYDKSRIQFQHLHLPRRAEKGKGAEAQGTKISGYSGQYYQDALSHTREEYYRQLSYSHCLICPICRKQCFSWGHQQADG